MKYNDSRYQNELFVKKYVTLWAYGYLNGYGQSEGLYSCITRLLSLLSCPPNNILDIGCGIGRSSFDAANLFKNSKIVGIDNSAIMIEYAEKINSNFYKNTRIDLPDVYINNLVMPSFNYKNIDFVNVSFNDYIKNQTKQLDLIINVNYLDRSASIKQDIKQMYNALSNNGYVIGSTPLNFRDYNEPITKKELFLIFQEIGFDVNIFFDNLIYQEVLDIRQSVEEYKVVCYMLKK